MKKKRRFLAGFLAGCMIFGQTVFAEEAVTEDQLYTESISEEAAVSEEQGETTLQSDLEADAEQTNPGIQEEIEHKEDSLEVQPEAGMSEFSDQKESREIVSQQQNEIEEVSLGENNEPVTISTEIGEAGETVRYCFRPEESGGYYIDLMAQGHFSIYEETSYGDVSYIDEAVSTENKFGSVVFDATAGTIYYVDIGYDDAESVGIIKWKLGRPQQVKTGSYEAVISEPGGKAHYEVLCEDEDMIYFDIDHWGGEYYADVYYDLCIDNYHAPLLSSGHYETGVQGKKCFVSIYYYDLTSTGTVGWNADGIKTQAVSESESIHTAVSSDNEHLVYTFVPKEDGKYGITYYNATVYDEFLDSVGNDKVDLKAGETYYIMLQASAGDDFYWSIKRSNEIVIEEGETIHTEADDVDYYKFIPEESGKYSISSYSVHIYDSDWNEIEGSKVDLLEGEIYYIMISGQDDIDWSISKMKETEITAGGSYLVAPEKSEYFKFVPDKSGKYTITTSGWMKLYDGEWNEMWDYELTAGETYYLMPDSTDETFYFSIDRSEDEEPTEVKKIEIQLGEECITPAEQVHASGFEVAVKYVFVPEETGRYQFCPEEKAYFNIKHNDEWLTSPSYPYYSISLDAGETYEITVRIPSALWHEISDVHWHLEKVSLTTITSGTEYYTSENNAQQYEFTPKSSGYYMIDANGEGTSAIYDSGYEPIESEVSDIYNYTDTGEFGSIIYMDAGQTYYINILSDSEEVSWKICYTEQTDEYLYRTMTDETVQILKYLGNNSSIEIPEYIDGKEVTSIGSGAFYEYGNLQSVIIPDGIRSIKTEAFYGCTELENIELGSELQEIGKSAFAWTSLTSIDLPDSLTTLGEGAFQGCASLRSIRLSTGLIGIEADTFGYCENLEAIELPENITYIAHSAFQGTGLREIDIPDSVISIGDSAFDSCSSLKEATIGSGVKSIGGYAFAFCDLTRLIISGNVQFIGESAFAGNSNLLEVELPDSVESIERSAFDNTKWYENQDNGSVYAGKVFYKYKGRMGETTTITVADGTKGIAEAAFEYQYRLEEIVLPDTLTNIGAYAFYGCELLTEVHIPQSVKEIGEYSLGYLDVNIHENTRIDTLKVPGFTIYGVAGSAAQTYAEENGFVFVEVEPEYTPGDIDESGRVDIADLRMVLRAVCGKTELTSQQQLAADVETDGTVNIADLRKILRFVCGKLEEL